MDVRRYQIDVRDDGGNSFTVAVTEGASTTTHVVTVWPSDIDRYAPAAEPERLVEASFRFLLTREPKESILRRFDLAVIEQYFPEFRSEVAGFLDDR